MSVILPNTQRSWIGKAHLVGKDVVGHEVPYGNIATTSSEGKQKRPWVLVNSTPASCAQLGLSHFFKDMPPIDLVVSGPNYGRNTTAVFSLSSGTMGAALEAAVCGYKAIAVSFAFFDRENDPKIVAQSCRQSVKVVEWLAKNGNWDKGRMFTVNVPVKDGVEAQPTVWTKILQNEWTSGSCFQENPSTIQDAVTEEHQLRKQESNGESEASESSNLATRHFKWAPSFKDVFESVRASGPGNDGYAVQQGQTSITAMRANFM